MAHRDGWSGLFATAFERSRNAMVLADAQRVIVDANPVLLALLGRTRDALTGRPFQSIVAHSRRRRTTGPKQWRKAGSSA
jgi:PAS domain S-box-containing protein